MGRYSRSDGFFDDYRFVRSECQALAPVVYTDLHPRGQTRGRFPSLARQLIAPDSFANTLRILQVLIEGARQRRRFGYCPARARLWAETRNWRLRDNDGFLFAS